MRTLTLCAALLLAWVLPLAALAQHGHAGGPGAAGERDVEAAVHAGAQVNHPVLPERANWAGVLVIVILLGLFLPAAVIGPIVRALAPEEEPVTHSHDEPPGASHHHGPSGTEDPHDPHGHPSHQGH